jgi:uncharacterized damage-inducible protein DinB
VSKLEKEELIKLFDYHIWAMNKLLKHLKQLPIQIYSQSLESVFPSISTVINHIYQVDLLWYKRYNNSYSSSPVVSLNTIDEALIEFNQLHTNMKADLLTRDHLKEFSYRNSKGEVYRNTIIEVIQHLVNHGTYHRGNISAMIRELGYPGISTDYIVYLREL